MFFLGKKNPQGCTTQKTELGMHQNQSRMGMLKWISNLFQSGLGRKFWWHGTWLRTSSENHTHASPRGSKGAMAFFIIKAYDDICITCTRGFVAGIRWLHTFFKLRNTQSWPGRLVRTRSGIGRLSDDHFWDLGYLPNSIGPRIPGLLMVPRVDIKLGRSWWKITKTKCKK